MTDELSITYPPELPVTQRREDIAAAIRDHQVVIVAGETGSGKTTQLPKICLELGRGRRGRKGGGLIGHTQPRRIAARSVAERIAEELGTELGGPDGVVGYQVRFTDRTSRSTRVKLMTDGILLAELQRDRMLRKYDTIIIDEAHERSLNIDFLLGYLRQLLPRRPDLKLVITSATIDPERFAAHFADVRTGEPAPIIEVSGRTYPVEVRYRPLMELPEEDEEGEPVVRDQTEAIADAVRELVAEGPGDILVFLPGEREIRDTAEVLEGLNLRNPLEIVPLYSRLSAAEQHRVFARHSGRRVVLATNVAETSLTVPGIRYVVDTGVARISRYSVRSKVQRLPIEAISQASANQRSGRCGRVEAGIAIRLYSEEDFAGRPEFTDPEILRTNLASVILQMASLGLGEVARFPFVEPPDRRNITAGVQLLEELGALRAGTASGAEAARGATKLTELGRRLARLPIDPRLGRMVLEAEKLGCLREVVVIAAALSLQDPRERPGPDHPAEQARADQLHARFKAEGSDFLTWLNLWRFLKDQQRELSGSAFRRMCKKEFLNYLRVREWQDFESQLRQVCKEMGVHVGQPADTPDADGIHQALLSGLLSQIGLLEERDKAGSGQGGQGGQARDGRRRGPREYLGARGARFAIFPGSVVARKNPPFVMAGELVETGRLWARQVAGIQPEWAERLGGDLVKRTWSEPHWSKKRAAVMAYERATLYGVPLVADRLVSYGKVDPALARELFIRHALVHGEWHSRHRFLTENQRLLEQAEELEHRARRRDLVVDEHTLFDFYDARVGAEVVSGAHFDQWWKQARRTQPDLLTFDPAMLTHDTVEEVRAEDYPEEWRTDIGAGLTFPISYHFEPGTDDDGLTIEVPVAMLNRVSAADFSWNVPGLREELVTALIRSLPKNLRVNLVPAPNRAREFLAEVPAGEEPLLDALERWCRARTGLVVPREAWDWDKVPEHLRPTYRVVDEQGHERGRGKDLEALKAPLRGSFQQAIADVASESGLSRTGETTWTFGTIERSFEQKRAGHEVQAYPALVDEGRTVGLQVYGSAEEQEARHRLGVRRLLLLELDKLDGRGGPVKRVLDGLGNAEKLGLAGSPYASVTDLLEDCRAAILGAAVDARPPVWSEQEYVALRTEAGRDLEAHLRAMLADVLRVLDAWRQAEKALSGRAEMAQLPALSDMKAQLGRLVHRGFIGEAGPAQLRRYPVYLAALAQRRARLDEGAAAIGRDRQLMDRIGDLQASWLHQVEALPAGRPPGESLRQVRWMLEEYRVSLWAQQLGTPYPVSDQRIRKALGRAGS
ncbi:ATP-dependent RNA helicase HrpA [Nocardioides sp. dk4132]|uniref:ATP-dependent RNA helicase HrpA n=1 Tax=unclassified Nocardioides TaxID=2615069 RepID=UPI00129808AC|nr:MULTISPECIES: ATP-dependent RNA helicase HrpA [unclassified Nocardioides]MQW74728.1 ATP-dependent RNA helicase HrpA [Nocardioides sp. dk4132]QGA06631.1 ATP-dependent RNA helicase HrpA [Nocardioides sp. dk884]